MMELYELMKHRRSIRKYQDRQIPKSDLEKIIEAGTYAPNAGGGQRSIIVGIHSKALTEKIGQLNLVRFDRSRLSGGFVSKEQPSVIDDPSMKSGFYGAPAVCVVFAQKNFLYSIPDSFCCAENMVLMAAELGISSCMHGVCKRIEAVRCIVICGRKSERIEPIQVCIMLSELFCRRQEKYGFYGNF